MIMLLANVLACISSVSATLATTESTVLPGGFDLSAISNPWLQALALMLGTFILEDTTAIAAGLLAHNGTISMPVAILGTGVGIYIGDLALYVMGAAAARGAKGTGWIRKRLPEARLAQLKGWLDRGSWKAVFLTRVISGTRLPVYLGAGFVGAGFAGFALWTAVAVALWTPLVVGGTALVGGSLIAWLEQHLGRSWTTWIVAAILVFITLHLALKSWRHRRAIFIATLRALRFEFWPNWAVYGPLLPWFAWQSLRFGGARTLTATNPCWPDGGAVGESKLEGLGAFDAEFTAPAFRVIPAQISEKALPNFTDALIENALAQLAAQPWTGADFSRPSESSTTPWPRPVIVKPDSGQRGIAVKLVRDANAFRAVFRASHAPLLVQRYEDGSCEVGLFVMRAEGERARLFAICEKRFPFAVGDGRASLREIIMRDRRLRLQERVFLTRLGDEADRIPAEGERIRLANAGNHAQGCLFVDGERLRTPALEAWVKRACESARGFHYGRLDVRFADESACMRGEGGVILEANGILSEATNMYDPSFGALRAWGIMRGHWREAFRIGAKNRARGVPGMALLAVLRHWREWRRTARLTEYAD
jgi:membrane protein DedA with SNARE-associated domain